MELLELEGAEESYMWHRQADGTYVDHDGFHVFAVVPGTSFNGSFVATVLVDGFPVMYADTETNTCYQPIWDDNEHQQIQAVLLEAIGEADEHAVNYVAEHSLNELWTETSHCGEGHEVCAFEDMVLESLANWEP